MSWETVDQGVFLGRRVTEIAIDVGPPSGAGDPQQQGENQTLDVGTKEERVFPVSGKYLDHPEEGESIFDKMNLRSLSSTGEWRADLPALRLGVSYLDPGAEE